jgi:hypothetical protein
MQNPSGKLVFSKESEKCALTQYQNCPVSDLVSKLRSTINYSEFGDKITDSG